MKILTPCKYFNWKKIPLTKSASKTFVGFYWNFSYYGRAIFFYGHCDFLHLEWTATAWNSAGRKKLQIVEKKKTCLIVHNLLVDHDLTWHSHSRFEKVWAVVTRNGRSAMWENSIKSRIFFIESIRICVMATSCMSLCAVWYRYWCFSWHILASQNPNDLCEDQSSCKCISFGGGN